MAERKRSVWEELLEIGRRIRKELEGLLDPAMPRPRQPARAPVPVRKDPGDPQRRPPRG